MPSSVDIRSPADTRSSALSIFRMAALAKLLVSLPPSLLMPPRKEKPGASPA
jgi:hypothetical protein